MSCSSTIAAMFTKTVRRGGDRPALGWIVQGQVFWSTWNELHRDVKQLASALIQGDVKPGDRVANISKNSQEWIVTDLALHMVRAVHVPMHASLPPVQISKQIKDCGARLAFVGTTQDRSEIRDLVGRGTHVFTHEYCDFIAEQETDEELLASLEESLSEDLATILYTSGTTGQPKGVMLRVGNLASNAAAVSRMAEGNDSEVRLCMLPLSHIYARTCDLYTWITLGSKLVLSESRETITRDCQLVQPTTINAVPYFYRKVHDKIRAAEVVDEPAALQSVLGGNIQNAFCGGAALAPEVEEWFDICGVPVLCGYGLTESSPVISISTSKHHCRGSVGKLLPEVEVQIAEDGEVLAKGPNVMLGYWQDEQATQQAIRDDWLHTGDLGEIDEGGFLKIRGRKKDIIVLSTGKNVSPTIVEGLLTASPLIEQIVVVGDGHSHLAALVVPCASMLRLEIRRRKVFLWSSQQALRSPKVRAIYEDEITRCLKQASREEQVRSFILLKRGFSIESGELTPKLSLRREVIASRFQNEIEAMYRK